MPAKKRALIYIKRNQIIVSVENNFTDFTIDLEESAVRNEEVVDKEILSKKVSDFFIRNSIFLKKFITVLDDEVLFYKDLSSINEYYRASLINEFISNVPFEKSKIFIKTLEVEDSFYIIAANKNFIKVIIDSIEATECKNISVLPYFLIHNIQNPFKIFRNKKLLHQLNLLNTDDKFEPQPINPPKKAKEKKIKGPVENSKNVESIITDGEQDIKHNSGKFKKFIKNIILASVFIGLIGASVYIVYDYIINFDEQVNRGTETSNPDTVEVRPIIPADNNTVQESNLEEIPAEQNSNEESNDESYLNKEDIRIQILNGTGVQGLANSTKEDIKSFDYIEDNIFVGNALIQTNTDLFVQSNIKDEDVNQIMEYLENNFKPVVKTVNDVEITDKENGSADTYNIVIITGNLIDNQN